MKDKRDLYEQKQEEIVIKIISVSESGDDALRHMAQRIDGVYFVYSSSIEKTNIRKVLSDANIVFLIGATDNSKINMISKITLELKILTIAVLTTFISGASKNITQLLCHVNEGKTLNNALMESVQSITDCMIPQAVVSVELSGIEQVLAGENRAIFSTSLATGDNRASDAVKKALASPLFRQADLKKASRVFLNIAASDVVINEFSDIGDVICANFAEDLTIRIGITKVELGEAMSVAIVAAVSSNKYFG
jgi:cell division GTPase FtsZ